MTSDVVAIVVNYGKAALTIRCLEALLRSEPNPPRIICVDNASLDDSVTTLCAWASQQHFEANAERRLVLLELSENGGFAAGNNAAIRWLKTQADFADTEHIWLLNNDAVPRQDALQHLAAEADLQADIIVGSTLVDHDGYLQCAGGYRYWPTLSLMQGAHAGAHIDELSSLPPIDLDYVCGASMMISVDTLDRIGLLDERFFLYCEELDFAKRLRSAKGRLVWARDSVVCHEIGSTIHSTAQTGGAGSELANLHENLSVFRLTWKHDRWRIPFVVCARLAMKTISTLTGRRWAAIAPICKAVKNFVLDPRGPSQRGGQVQRVYAWPQAMGD